MHNVTQWGKAIQVCYRSGAQCECCAIDLSQSCEDMRDFDIVFFARARWVRWTELNHGATIHDYWIIINVFFGRLSKYRSWFESVKLSSLTGVVSTRCTYYAARRADRNFNIGSCTHKKKSYLYFIAIFKQYQDDLQLIYVRVEWNMSKK